MLHLLKESVELSYKQVDIDKQTGKKIIGLHS